MNRHSLRQEHEDGRKREKEDSTHLPGLYSSTTAEIMFSERGLRHFFVLRTTSALHTDRGSNKLTIDMLHQRTGPGFETEMKKKQ